MGPLQSSLSRLPSPVLAPVTTEPDPDALLTARQAAVLLAVPVCHVYGETRRGAESRLPHVRIGRYVRFRRADLLAWLSARTIGGANGAAR